LGVAMGVKESDNYHTGGEGGGADNHDLRSRRSWGQWFQNGVEDFRSNYISSSTTDRLSRRSKEFVEEHVPSFSRALAAGSRTHVLLALVVVLSIFTVVHYILQPPNTGLDVNLVPAPSLCASQDDMYDTATRLCQVGNKYAYWYLRNKDWVQCAPNVPGYKMLLASGDMQSNYWYPFSKAKTVKEFYDTCIPQCATDEDTYHSTKDLCMVTDGVLITWLSGDGQYCGQGTIGEKAINRATASLRNAKGYWYAPDAAGKVRELLETCHGQCAKGDVELHDHAHCQVMNSLALQFIGGRGGTCDTRLPGYRLLSAMGSTKDVQGAYMYAKTTGDELEQFYLSCMRGWESKGHAGAHAMPHNAETIGGHSLGAYAASQARSQEMKRWDEALLDADYRRRR